VTDGFRNRVTTNVAPMQQRNPAAFRSGLVEGLDAVGDALGRAAAQDAQMQEQVKDDRLRTDLKERERWRSRTVVNTIGALEDGKTALGDQLAKLRSTVPPEQYRGKADEAVTTWGKQFVESLPDDEEVYDRIAPMVAQYSGRVRDQEHDWSRRQDAAIEGANLDKYNNGANNALAAGKPTDLPAALAAVDTIVGATDLDPGIKAQLSHRYKAERVTATFNGMLARGETASAKALLANGMFDGFMDDGAKTNLLRQIDAAEQVSAREAELAKSRTRDEARDAIKAVKAKVKAGIAPAPSELQAVQRQATRAKLDAAELIDFGALAIKVQVNRTYTGRSADSMRRDRDALAGKIGAGKATEAEQVMKAQLDDLVDIADDREVGALRDLARQGPAGKSQALATLTGDAAARYDKAEKIEPGLGALANLGPKARIAALEGRETRKARPKDFGESRDVETAARKTLGPAIAGQLGGAYRTVVDTAWDIMAQGMAANGQSGFSAEGFRAALGTAMGATRRPDGYVQGGVQAVRGKPVWLPRWQTATEFDGQLSRTDFGGATYANGDPVAKADVLANYRADYVGDDADGAPLYHLVDGMGDALRGNDGSAFVLRPRRPR
jgi:hypothetical protein